MIIVFAVILYDDYENYCTYLRSNDYRWENSDAIKYNNCYAYAFRDLDLNRKSKPQPGFLSNLKPLRKDQFTCKNFIQRIISDFPDTTYHGFSIPKCGCNRHAVFLAIDNRGKFRDYHFYRQNSNGYWTHKPGSTNVYHNDSDGNIITNPLYANRKYKLYNYSVPCGFFCVSSIEKNTGHVSEKAR